MNFETKLKKLSRDTIWKEYCGFADMSIRDYMYIQKRLMEEQIRLFSDSDLGRELLRGKSCDNIDDFREAFPLTTYDDYADTLLQRDSSKLPADALIWIETTWEGGLKPVKVAPYTQAMLDTYRHNVLSSVLFCTGEERGDFDLKAKDRFLYGGAPLPYMTGLIPSLMEEDIHVTWLPDANTDPSVSFSQRIKQGFKMGLSGGVDFFIAMGAVANYITEHFADSTGKRGGSINYSLPIAANYLRAKHKHKQDGGKLVPKDIFKLKGLMVSGTDSNHYTDRLEKAWGVRPFTIAAGTELTYAGTETTLKDGMVMFPDACFYEFIPESELRREEEEEGYVPRTLLMDEVRKGEFYEIVISVLHGGAFMRYRIGDMYHCVAGSAAGSLPRFYYHDRVRDIIDIAGFTRITENSIREVIERSGLAVYNWTARKEFDETDTPFLHMYVETKGNSPEEGALVRSQLNDHLALYFRYFDSDYQDLKKLLEMEPLQITILKKGTIEEAEWKLGRKIRKINPTEAEIGEIMNDRGAPIPSIMLRREMK